MTERRRAGMGEALAWLRREATAATPDACLSWPFALRHGYGVVWFQGRVQMAHRVALALVGREVPAPPLETRHLCGVAACVNPHHLVAGTPAQNQADRVRHGTSNRGERQGSHKLTEADIRFIRQSPVGVSALARQLGVTHSAVSMIRTGKRWAHVR